MYSVVEAWPWDGTLQWTVRQKAHQFSSLNAFHVKCNCLNHMTVASTLSGIGIFSPICPVNFCIILIFFFKYSIRTWFVIEFLIGLGPVLGVEDSLRVWAYNHWPILVYKEYSYLAPIASSSLCNYNVHCQELCHIIRWTHKLHIHVLYEMHIMYSVYSRSFTVITRVQLENDLMSVASNFGMGGGTGIVL